MRRLISLPNACMTDAKIAMLFCPVDGETPGIHHPHAYTVRCGKFTARPHSATSAIPSATLVQRHDKFSG
ncbi:MAG TPA: hypothetical protein VGN39_15460, partial [Terriglobales bacterium]|nr:hypothetical protein [Terriglobales bacterium]